MGYLLDENHVTSPSQAQCVEAKIIIFIESLVATHYNIIDQSDYIIQIFDPQY